MTRTTAAAQPFPDLPSQDAIMAGWKEETTVSICCVTYNQAKYIRDALDGFLRQKTDFRFEILVHDDASTDGTADIIREYAAAYPDLFVPILQTENQFSRGRNPFAIVFSHVRGALVALCEGDDYWTDPGKLQRQLDVMRDNPSVQICTHASLDDRENVVAPELDGGQTALTIREVISKDFVIPTASIMLRRRTALEYMTYSNERPSLPFSDLYIRFLAVMCDSGIHLNRYMCFTRVLSEGSWSARNKADYRFRLDNRSRKLRSFEELNAMSRGREQHVFRTETYSALRFTAVDRTIPLGERVKFLRDHADLLSLGLNLRLAAALLKRELAR